MKGLKTQNDRVVYLGNASEKLSWGDVQFPILCTMRNGNIGLAIHVQQESWLDTDVDTSNIWFVSEDKGVTWRKATKEDRAMMGTVLPNGDVLRALPNPNKSLQGVKEVHRFSTYFLPTDELIPQKNEDDMQLPSHFTTVTAFECVQRVYWLDTISDNLIEKRFCFHRLNKGETEAKTVFANVEWKHRTVTTLIGNSDMLGNPGLLPCREVVVAPDGSLYLAHYRSPGANPFTGVYSGNSEAYILRSTDNGESWKIHGYIPYQPDEEKDYFAHLKGGFSEPSIAFIPDGSMLCLLRTCDVSKGAPEWGATYLTRSFDGGKTWEKPEYFADRGALPKLLQLKCGVTLAVITRPGIYVYASEDFGKTWSKKIEIMTDEDRSVLANEPPQRPNFHQWVGSCCNCTILPIADNKAILAYSDFYIPDEKGVKRKGIKTVEIVVE